MSCADFAKQENLPSLHAVEGKSARPALLSSHSQLELALAICRCDDRCARPQVPQVPDAFRQGRRACPPARSLLARPPPRLTQRY